MAVRAVEPILNGVGPVIQPGQDVPAVYTDQFGDEHDRDLDRLVALGLAENVKPKVASRPRRSAAKREG